MTKINRTEKITRKFLEEACKKQASDIHFYPSHDEDHVDIFYRLLGKRVYIRSIKKKLYAIILAYLKYSAHMDISEKRKPQSGKMHYTTESKELYALRLSTLPTMQEESLTIRLLPQSNLKIEELFVFPYQFNRMKQWFHQQAGLILITGPTGCGKSTTMYALMQALTEKQSYQAITLEDPIERTLDNVIQVEMNERAGISYHTGLKAALRHDPDIIMIGEIRDEKTAKFALEASLTGHLVVSTIHAKNAVGTIDRLLDLNISKNDIAQTLLAIASIQLIPVFTRGDVKRGAIMELIDGNNITSILSGNKEVEQLNMETFEQLKEKVKRYGFLQDDSMDETSKSV